MKLRMFLYNVVVNRLQDLKNAAQLKYKPKSRYYAEAHKYLHGLVSGTLKFKTKLELKELQISSQQCCIDISDLIQNGDSYIEILDKVEQEERDRHTKELTAIDAIYETYKDKLVNIQDSEVEDMLTKYTGELEEV